MNIYRKSHVPQGVPIVPMLDILTILLIFFIVHTEFKHQVNVLKLALPQTKHLSGERGDDSLTLLEVGADGELALGGKKIERDALERALDELMKTTPQTRIQVAAAEGASIGGLIEILDTITAAGIPVEQVPLRINYSSGLPQTPTNLPQ